MPFSVKVNPFVCVRRQLVLGMDGGIKGGMAGGARCGYGSEEKAAFSCLHFYFPG